MLDLWYRYRDFDPISQQEECESLSSQRNEVTIKDRRRRPMWIPWMLIIAGFMVTFLVGVFLGSLSTNQISSKAKETLRYTPVMGDIGLRYRNFNFNGSLFLKNSFRQDAGPEVDAAWTSLGVNYRSAIVPAKTGESAGLRKSQVQVSDKYGGGFPANVEGLHHLHCLNLVRSALYYNFEYYHKLGEGAFRNSDDILKAHITHCLDTIRQQLMCTVDVGVLGQVWWKKSDPQAFPDFNTEHRCRDFEAVRQWAEEHQAPEKVPDDYLKPPQQGDVLETMP